MKLINIFKNNRLLLLAAIVMMVFGATIFSMKRSAIEGQSQQQAQPQQQQEGKYFIYQTGTLNGIWVDKEFVKQSSRSLADMIEDIGGELNEIPLNYPSSIIQLGFNILDDNADLRGYSLEDMVHVANMFNFLDVPKDKLKVVLEKIKKDIEIDGDKIVNLKELNSDLQSSILLNPTIDCLKKHIIKKYASDRNKVLLSEAYPAKSIAFSSDGKKIVLGIMGSVNNLILFDVSNVNNIMHQFLVGHNTHVNAVAFSPDGKTIISASAHNLILWDVSNPNNVMHQSLVGPTDRVKLLAFSPDGRKIVSGSLDYPAKLILWDISNSNNITYQQLKNPLVTVNLITFSPDSSKIVAGGKGYGPSNKNLVLFDISNLHDITHKSLACNKGVASPGSMSLLRQYTNPDEGVVTSVAFSPDGKQMVSVSGKDYFSLWDDINSINPQPLKVSLFKGKRIDRIHSVAFSPDGIKVIANATEKGPLILFDASDLNNITHQLLGGVRNGKIHSVAFSPDGTKIALAGEGHNNILVLWTLFTDQEKFLLNQLKNYTVDQLRLIYQLCLESAKGTVVLPQKNSPAYEVFMTLPEEIRKLLNNLFFIKSFDIKSD